MSLLADLILGYLDGLEILREDFETISGQTAASTIRAKLLACRGMIENWSHDENDPPF
jgi:hypothetical protein